MEELGKTTSSSKHTSALSRGRTLLSAFVLLVIFGVILYSAEYVFLIYRGNVLKSRGIRIHFYNKPRDMSDTVFDQCEYPCHMTYGYKSDFTTSKFVIFSAPELERKFAFRKPQGHVWIFYSMEPPFLHSISFDGWRNAFNWTMTFRRDSDIYNPYGHFLTRRDNSSVTIRDDWEYKTRDAVWMVSHCRVQSGREFFVRKLKNYIGLDTYGRCGNFTCRQSQESKCNEIIQKKYKYYIAFENALCKDYITEKSHKIFYNSLYVVPVTRGVQDVAVFLPPGSYIQAEHFQTIQDLGNHLSRVSSAKALYMSHFKSRIYYEGLPTGTDGFCELCRRVHHPQRYIRLYQNINIWLHGDKTEPHCRHPSDYGDVANTKLKVSHLRNVNFKTLIQQHIKNQNYNENTKKITSNESQITK